MKMIDLYKRAESMGPEYVKYFVQFFIGGVDMLHEGFTNSKERPDFPHSDWCVNQWEEAFKATIEHVEKESIVRNVVDVEHYIKSIECHLHDMRRIVFRDFEGESP